MGNAEGKSMLYLEARCLFLTKACGVQGIQNGSINAIPLVAALPNGFRAISAENLIASMLNIEVASGNDTAFSHSDMRRGVKLMLQMLPGTDFITSGFGSIPNLDNVFAGSNSDCDDYDDFYVFQRDMKVDGGLKPISEEEAITVRNKAAKVCQTVFKYLNLPEITDEEVEAATYAYCYKDMPARNKVEDMKAATEMMDKGVTGFDIVKGLYENGFADIAERVLQMLKQRVIGDYLHTSSIFDENYNVLSAINDRNDYKGPGTGYKMSSERWNELKQKQNALKPQTL
jgi:propanediol dehydratase large subunit/glycerol dehydratase large subunit